MQFFDVFISLAALLCFCAFFSARFGVNSAFTPLGIISATILYFTVFGCFDALLLAGYAYYVLAAAALAYTVHLYKTKKAKACLCTPGFLLFCAVSVSVLVLFAIREPMFIEWDEFSFWGIASKIVKQQNRVYTIVTPNPMVGIGQNPGLILFGYFLQFLGGAFAEWKVLAAYNLIFFATWAAAIGAFNIKRWKTAVPVTVICFLLPFFFTVYFKQVYTVNTYFSAYADIPMGMMVGGILACWYGSRQNKGCGYGTVLLGLAALTLFKEMGLAFAAITATLIAADLLFIEKEFTFCRLKGIAAKIVAIICSYGAIGVCFVGWSKYLSYAYKIVDRYQSGGTAAMGYGEMLITGIGQLFAREKDPWFSQIMGQMWQAFYSSDWKLSMVGSGVAVVALIVAVLLLTLLLSGDKRHRLRTGLYLLLTVPAFICYYIFIGFTYVYIFKPDIAAGLDSYNRYISPFYLGWLFGAVVLLAIGAKQSRIYGVLKGAVIGLSAVCLLRFNQLVMPQLCIIDYSDVIVTDRAAIKQQAAHLSPYLDNDAGTVFFVSQDDNGKKWFYYTYELYPFATDSDPHMNGGILAAPGALPADTPYYHPYTKAAFQAYLEEKSCGYLFIETLDALFIEEYADLFADKLAYALSGETCLYKIEGSGSTFV
ncbi:MAG: hypothetical protein PHG02_10110, partial [Oscillospiraceae bacterium]|nr:hypothetical protein [Oscillospiraceae bacterium]